MNHLITIVGPTGVGKSRLAFHLARIFDGEIISADSRQVYRYMDIGTAKPSKEELSVIPHHLISIINPDDDFSLTQYQALAHRAIQDIQNRDKLPILVGGSGQYVWAVLEGWKPPQIPPDHEYRHDLEKKATITGTDELYQELVRVDPEAAQKIDSRNVRRVIRALEVQRQTNAPFSRIRRKEAPSFDSFIIGLTLERKELYGRIDQRVDEMIRQGLVAEVENLAGMRYDFRLPAMSSIGYRQIGLFLKGELNLATAIEQTKSETHRFVRHQYAWFRLKDERIHWFDVQHRKDSEIETILAEFLKSKQTAE